MKRFLSRNSYSGVYDRYEFIVDIHRFCHISKHRPNKTDCTFFGTYVILFLFPVFICLIMCTCHCRSQKSSLPEFWKWFRILFNYVEIYYPTVIYLNECLKFPSIFKWKTTTCLCRKKLFCFCTPLKKS